MSNLSQFFALGGNKIKSIQTVTAQQQFFVAPSYTWSGVTASISAVDPSKTLLICSPSANGVFASYDNGGVGGYSNTGHGAYLSSSTIVAFYGPSISNLTGLGGLSGFTVPAQMVVQVVEFE